MEDKNLEQNKNQNAAKNTAHTAGKAATTYFGGATGNHLYNEASNTEVKKKLEQAIGNGIQQNPALNHASQALNDSGALAADSKGLDQEMFSGDNGLSNKNDDLNNTTNDTELSNVNKDDSQKSNVINNITGTGSSNNEASTNDDNINSDYSSKIFNFFKEHIPLLIANCSGLFMTILVAIVAVVVVGSVCATIAEFFSGIVDSVVGFFTKDQQELENDFKNKLSEIKNDIQTEYNVCIDVNLITAALTIHIDADKFLEDGKEVVEDSVDDYIDDEDLENENNESGSITYSKKMVKNIRLLANMQMITTNYVLDSSDDYCSIEEEIIPITSGSKDSSTKELIASNDKGGISALLTSKTYDEQNNAYYIYKPPYAEDGSCSHSYAKEKLKEIKSNVKKEISIGNLKTREDSVFYWNLINSFIPSYYDDYIPKDEPQKSEIIKQIADDIYLLYSELGSSCNSNSCVQLSSSSLCPNGIEVVGNDGSSKLIDLEKYVAGVVAAENSWHDGDNIESLKAQAIAARTYALKVTNSCASSIKNSTVNQTYKETNDPYILRAVQETNGMIIMLNNEIFSTEYDAFCVIDNSSDNYILKQQNQEIPKSWVDNHRGITESYKKCLCNSNTKLDICRNSKGEYLDGGHGRGMSQIGARYLQTKGYKYYEILKYYYGDNITIASTSSNNGESNVCSSGGTSIIGNFVSHTCDYGLGSKELKYWQTSYGKDNNKLNTFNTPQCTWYTYGRAIMALEESTGLTATEARDLMYSALLRGTGRSANAADWFDLNVDSNTFAYSTDITKPKPGAIIVWSGGAQGYGHVGFIEKVEYDENGNAEYVWVTEGNPSPCYYNKRTLDYIRSYASAPKTKYFKGYIYVVSDGG